MTGTCLACSGPVPHCGPGRAARYCSEDCKPRCSVDGCDGPRRKRGWCASHYGQARRTGADPVPFLWRWGQEEPRPYVARKPREPRFCDVQDCDGLHSALGFCVKHEARFRRYGDPAVTHRQHRGENGPCVVCGSEESTIKSHWFCSKRCERLHYAYAGEIPQDRTCAQCGTVTRLDDLTPRGNRRKASGRLCTKCSRSGWRTECLSVHQLAERDGIDCALCDLPINMALRRSDGAEMPSIDHILPRSRGGGNEPENLQLAHLRCNVLKRDHIEVRPTAKVG